MREQIADLELCRQMSPPSDTELMNKAARHYLPNISTVTDSGTDSWVAQMTPGSKQFMATWTLN
jgi:hypothetical protein